MENIYVEDTIINMKNMFDGCILFNELNLINFDLINIKKMDNFIAGCKSLNF